MQDRIRVMLTTEGTYPFHQGGVSTWCEMLVTKLDSVDFVVQSVIANPFVTQKFQLPSHATLQVVPLWGTEEPKEHLSLRFRDIYLPKKQTTENHIEERFLPLFRQLVEEIICEVKHPRRFGQLLVELYDYFQECDYQVSFKSERTWQVYKEWMLAAAAQESYRLSQPDVHGLIQSLGWVYRFLNILNTPLPDVHVTHASAAAFCALPCVVAKVRNGTPFLLTEHGIYLREQYLSLSKRPYSPFLTTFLIRFVQAVTQLCYAFADQVSPVCEYNTRWETRFGVPLERVKVIVNGADPRVFTEAPRQVKDTLTVVMVARVDPLKDVLMFLEAAALVRQRFANVKFVVHGSVSVPEYYEQCLALHERLGLGDSFVFAGHTSNVAAALQSGDIVALSSISEAFPYSVVEAMMTGKPVVATDVGGVREALDDTGLLVDPRNPEQFADAVLKLLQNGELREELGREARQRALNFFTVDKVLELHLKRYIKLAVRADERVSVVGSSGRLVQQDRRSRQKLAMEKGYALASHGLWREAIEQFRAALREMPDSPYTPILLTELSRAYNRLGEYDEAFAELEKCTAYVELMEEAAREIA